MSELSRSLQRMVDLLKDNFNHIRVETASRWSNSPWHIQDSTENQFEISYTLSGTRHLIYGEQEIDCKPGGVFIWDSIHPGACKTGHFTYCYIIFNVADDYVKKEELLSALHACTRHLSNITCPFDQSHSIEQLFLDASIEMMTQRKNFELATKLIILNLFLIVGRMVASDEEATPLASSRKYTDLVVDVVGYLSNRLDQTVSLSELGEHYQLNPRYLNRIFKGVTGYPMIHYILKMKMEKAKKLLLSSDMNQMEIALEVGMGSSQYFNHMFKKIVGVTPSQYRKRGGL